MTYSSTSPSVRFGPIFQDRREAGRVVARLLGAYQYREDVVVLGLPRGGIPVAWEVAAALGAPLEALVVRKIGAPGQEEFAVGAIASGGHVVVNDDILRALRVTPDQFRDIAEREGRELLRRETVYRQGRPPIDLTGKTVILVDDGLATGASMLAAIQAVNDANPAEVVVAVPAASESTCRELSALVDDVVCATMPTPFRAVGESFWDFRQTTDNEVLLLLSTPTTPRIPTAGPAHVADVVRLAATAAPDGVPPAEDLERIIGDADIVLIGESSHGTHEFYQARASITKWLIAERGFCAVAAEADWPDAYRVNRYVRGQGSETSATEALSGFERFPTWMWRNTVVSEFVDWLQAHNNQCRSRGEREAGFYGLDLYSMHRSMHEVIRYLDEVDPDAAERARIRYSCFGHAPADDGQSYGFAAAYGAGPSCEREAVEQLEEMRRNAWDQIHRDGLVTDDEAFCAAQNAQTVRNAEAYYRSMFQGQVKSWNMRDRHMVQTLRTLIDHLTHSRQGAPTRIVVWAHNSHVGDARATEVGSHGQLTLGQLVRERYAGRCRLIGLTTYSGTVTAASEWGGPAERKTVMPALNGSIEELFHETKLDAFLISPNTGAAAAEALAAVRLGRAIGVIYRPDTERQSHYYHVRPGDQYDAIIHIDNTRALTPLETSARWVEGETPETYPTGL
ncbi:erythromycin esterase family protein [Mycobacteroides abscessus]|uniref:Erythromycin esterase n=2 Tax=Mycobacteroides abscessus TaxID=36809 RepID=A0A1U4T2Y8_9MYCO|nr:erythromycin esterase family protein [Mycobacteroides abscessus]EIV63973.1 hypothetical protein MMCCUG48898_2878 [Mycobacteroides abscessus subsp. massiliense CCUG 48898 = JCM 15300]MBE5403991.1 hypothetical protein [Mycobacteroides abscessus]MBE5431321.1 hypothetical protein [Mycobacteroides abscessus]MBE5443876.1 hypothetical protein [Mycobacteroides abscessus]MBE5500321.1 hypothetical protein [Mycobacteroides abscessus]